MAKLSFEDLLKRCEDESGIDVVALKEKSGRLEERRSQLQKELEEINEELRSISRQIQNPLKNAVRAAELLRVDIPEVYLDSLKNGNGSSRSNGKFWWEVEGHKPFQAEPSRALWRFSKGCNGSAGSEGVLTTDEFWNLVFEQTGKKSIDVGEEVEVTLPNQKRLKLKKIA